MTINYIQEVPRDSGSLDGVPCHVCGAIMVPFKATVNGRQLDRFWYCLSCFATTACTEPEGKNV